MFKLNKILMAMAFGLGCLGFAASASAGCPGDLNNDGVIDATDKALMRNLMVGISSGANRGNADMNGDGRVTAVDMSRLNAIANGTRCTGSSPEYQKVVNSVGRVIANTSGACYKTPKNGFTRGQCTWYAKGRFCEVTGRVLDFPGGSDARYWGTKVKERNSVTVDGNPTSKSIGITQSGGQGRGHVIFIEYVDGNNIYYSDANAGYTAGTVRKMSRSELLNKYKQFIH